MHWVELSCSPRHLGRLGGAAHAGAGAELGRSQAGPWRSGGRGAVNGLGSADPIDVGAQLAGEAEDAAGRLGLSQAEAELGCGTWRRREEAREEAPGHQLGRRPRGRALGSISWNKRRRGQEHQTQSEREGREGGAVTCCCYCRRRRAPADEVAGRRQGRRRRPGTRDSDLMEKAHGHEGKAAATSSCGGFVRQRRCSGELGDKAPRTRQEGKKRRKGIGARRCCSLYLSLAALEGEIERGEREMDRARVRVKGARAGP